MGQIFERRLDSNAKWVQQKLPCPGDLWPTSIALTACYQLTELNVLKQMIVINKRFEWLN